MYFNENKEDTNIDDELNGERTFDFSKYKVPLIIICAVILIIVLIAIISGNKKNYFVELKGDVEISVTQGNAYEEPGYRGFDNKGNDLTSEVVIDSNLDTSVIGDYTLTYTLKDTSVQRIVKVVQKASIAPYIYLKGETNIQLTVGDNYREPGFTAIDTIDGDLTDRVIIDSNVDTSKPGTYKIVYSVINSSDIKTTESRIVIVK